MSLKKYKPTTPSLRSLVQVDKSGLWKGSPMKTLTCGLTESGGRNNNGRITVYHRGGGHKKKYRFVDYKRVKNNMVAEVLRIEYDPNRTAFIALIQYEDKTLSYILAPSKLSVGDKVVAGSDVDISFGNTLPLKNIPTGTMIHNIEYIPGKGGQVVRSAGSFAQLISRDDNGYCLIRLPSGEDRLFPENSHASIGILSNIDHKNIVIGKAGRSRWLGRKPVVRGVAMNPVDHPHGGGQGKTSGGRPSVTPWSWPTKGQPTRSKRKHNALIVQRAKKRI
uniref:Large ribosomal subunit protein uL2m n=1 Tax=Histiona aroides TaxID=392300 RepID=M4QKQ3_HISAR|nr:ribosomal protein L2 [Histiona aroides]AGH24048.1 ribosomal protein L2 [Histiona aroides]